jgi:hypothetical protein
VLRSRHRSRRHHGRLHRPHYRQLRHRHSLMANLEVRAALRPGVGVRSCRNDLLDRFPVVGARLWRHGSERRARARTTGSSSTAVANAGDAPVREYRVDPHVDSRRLMLPVTTSTGGVIALGLPARLSPRHRRGSSPSRSRPGQLSLRRTGFSSSCRTGSAAKSRARRRASPTGKTSTSSRSILVRRRTRTATSRFASSTRRSTSP